MISATVGGSREKRWAVKLPQSLTRPSEYCTAVEHWGVVVVYCRTAVHGHGTVVAHCGVLVQHCRAQVSLVSFAFPWFRRFVRSMFSYFDLVFIIGEFLISSVDKNWGVYTSSCKVGKQRIEQINKGTRIIIGWKSWLQQELKVLEKELQRYKLMEHALWTMGIEIEHDEPWKSLEKFLLWAGNTFSFSVSCLHRIRLRGSTSFMLVKTEAQGSTSFMLVEWKLLFNYPSLLQSFFIFIILEAVCQV